jgi:hypothetical protein
MDFTRVIEDESAALAAALHRTGTLTGVVPACPGWTGDDLAKHIGEVQDFWTHVVRAGGERVPRLGRPQLTRMLAPGLITRETASGITHRSWRTAGGSMAGKDVVVHETDMLVSELASDRQGALAPYGEDIVLPLPIDRLGYHHPTAADRPHLLGAAADEG